MATILRNRVTILCTTPSMFFRLGPAAIFSHATCVRVLMLGGEALFTHSRHLYENTPDCHYMLTLTTQLALSRASRHVARLAG